MANGTSMKWSQNVLYTLAGPLAGLGLSLAAFMLLSAIHLGEFHFGAARYRLERPFSGQSRLSLLNLIPLASLDGGQITATISTRLLGRKGFLLAQIVSVLILAYGCSSAFSSRKPGEGVGLLPIFLVMLGVRTAENIAGYFRGDLPFVEASHPSVSDVAVAESAYQQGDFERAGALSKDVLNSQNPPLALRNRAHFVLGWVALKLGEGRTALDHFAQIQGIEVPPEALAAGFSLIGDEVRAIPQTPGVAAYNHSGNELVLHELAGALIRGGREGDARKLGNVKPAQAFAAAERVLFVRGEYDKAAQMAEASFAKHLLRPWRRCRMRLGQGLKTGRRFSHAGTGFSKWVQRFSGCTARS